MMPAYRAAIAAALIALSCTCASALPTAEQQELLAWVRDRYDFHRRTKDFILLFPGNSQERSGDR